MRLSTRSGDQGETGLRGGQRLSKAHPRVQAYGEVDEVNSLLGWARAAVEAEDVRSLLQSLQEDLMRLGADLALPPGAQPSSFLLGPERVQALEEALERYQEEVPPLRHFVLPGGTEAAARLHIVRTACRRAERAAVALAQEEPVNPEALRYLNRLSDLLFLLALVLNHRAQAKEIPWQG